MLDLQQRKSLRSRIVGYQDQFWDIETENCFLNQGNLNVENTLRFLGSAFYAIRNTFSNQSAGIILKKLALSKITLTNILEYLTQRVECSHLCHNPNCVNDNHIVFESMCGNLSRNSCRDWAERKTKVFSNTDLPSRSGMFTTLLSIGVQYSPNGAKPICSQQYLKDDRRWQMCEGRRW